MRQGSTAFNEAAQVSGLFPKTYRVPYTSLTGVTTETLVATLTIPGNVLQAGDFLVFDTFFGPLSTPTGNQSVRINLSNSTNQNIASANATNQNRFFRRVISVRSDSLILHPDDLNGHPSGFGTLPRSVTANLANPTLIRFYITPSNSGDTWLLPFVLLQHIRPSLAYAS